MSNKRSLNNQNHHFQISIDSQIDTKNLKFGLQDDSDERENHRINGEDQFQISMKKHKFDLPDDREDEIGDGEEKFEILMNKLKFDLEDKSKERENQRIDGEDQFEISMKKVKFEVADEREDESGDGEEKVEMLLMKKLKFDLGVTSEERESLFARLDENLLYEIFKHADARTLAVLSCVSKIWNRTAQDERLWELICTRRWIDVNHGGGEKQLRSVVLALGGFRRLYSLYLSKTAAASAPLAVGGRRGSKRWGKDEVNLSLSLLSIQFYEKMNNNTNTNSKGK